MDKTLAEQRKAQKNSCKKKNCTASEVERRVNREKKKGKLDAVRVYVCVCVVLGIGVCARRLRNEWKGSALARLHTIMRINRLRVRMGSRPHGRRSTTSVGVSVAGAERVRHVVCVTSGLYIRCKRLRLAELGGVGVLVLVLAGELLLALLALQEGLSADLEIIGGCNALLVRVLRLLVLMLRG